MTIDLKEWQKAENDLGQAYLRLRHMIPGALNTPHAPTPEQVWETTEQALLDLLKGYEEIRQKYYEVLNKLSDIVDGAE